MADLNSGIPDLHHAITEATGASLVTSWVLVAACIDDDGTETLARLNSPGLPYWQTHGMLSSAALATAGQPEWTHTTDDDGPDCGDTSAEG